MPPSLALPRPGSYDPFENLPRAWRRQLVWLASVLAALFVLMHDDWLAMADKWWNISTYNHVLFVPPIVVWLLWQRRAALARIAPTAWPPAMLPFGGALLLWLLGNLAGFNSASQHGAVLAMLSAVVLLLGPRVALAAGFPLGFLLFLVPFGDELVPALQLITAKIVIALTVWSGIPAQIDGVFINTPVGLFEVAEACSGVKFLVAMFALGLLISYCCLTSWSRRLAFMGSALLLSVLANGIRAWGTIYIAQSQGIAFAEGFDHIFYGWIFFALVIGVMLAAWWRWFDRDPETLAQPDFPSLDQSPLFEAIASVDMPLRRAAGAALAFAVVIGGWSLMAARIEAPVPAQIGFPAIEGWDLVDYSPEVPWKPRASGAEHRLLARYRNAEGQQVDVFFAWFAAQREGHEASAYGEGAFDPQSDWRWLAPVRAGEGAQGEELFAWGRVKRRAETSYRTGDLLTGSAGRLKLANMLDRLMLRPRPTMLLILSAEQTPATDPARAIAQFRAAIAADGGVGAWMDRIAGLR